MTERGREGHALRGHGYFNGWQRTTQAEEA